MKKFSKIVMAMRRVSLFAALVVAMTAVSCVKEMNVETPENPVEGPVTFEATFGAVSKAVLEVGAEKSKVAWETTDQVSVLVGEGNYLYVAETAGYTTILKTDAANVPVEGDYYAVYPYDEDAILEGNVITTSLPATQAAVLNSFSSHLSVSQAVENTFSFRNVCGLVRVNVASDGVTKVTFAGNKNENVAGKIAVTVSGSPTYEVVEGATTLELVPAGDATTLARGDYYLAVLPQTFESGITVTAYKGDNAWDVRKTSTSLTIERSDMKNSNPFGVVGSGTEADPYLLDSPQDLVEMRDLATVGGETWFKMIKDIDLEGINWVPVNYDQNYNRKIHFDGGNFTISNLTCDKTASASNYASLFGVLYGSCKNLKIDKATITSTNGCGVLGGYVGTNKKPAYVENVIITNSSVTNAGQPTGGVAGVAREGTFKNVSFQGTVTSTLSGAVNANAGGFVGLTTASAAFEGCSTDVTIDATASDAGGFIGQLNGTVTFTDCNAKAIVNTRQTEKHRCAAFVGYSNGVATYSGCKVLEGSKISDASGNTSSKLAMVGGFMGYAGGTSVTVENCSVNITIDFPNGQNVGGFLGLAGTGAFKADGCSVVGKVDGNNQVGGFVAAQEENASVEIATSYSAADVSGSGHYIGAFAGNMKNGADKPIKLTDCYATGDVLKGDSSCSAFVAAVNADVTMERCYATGAVANVRGNIGGLLGYATSGTVSIKNSYFTGTLKSSSGPTAGIMGYSAAKATISDTYVKDGSIEGGAGQIAGLVGHVGAESMTITDCYVELDIKASGNPSSGLVGLVNGNLDLSDCYYKGNLTGNAYLGGAVGQINTNSTHCHISRVSTEGTFYAGGNYSGCIVGASMGKDQKITDCWSSADLTGKGQQVGGVVGAVTASVTIDNCFSSGDIVTNTSGSAGIAGRVAVSSTITDCIAWNKNITCNRTSNGVYAPGAILGCAQEAGTYSGCWRRADMVFTDPYMVLSDQEDFISAMPPRPSYSTATHQQAYHGKAAAADATISSVAKSLGWDETIWDLSKDVPTLK